MAHQETLAALAGSLELRERYTAGHSRRVRDYALLVAHEMGLRDQALLASLAQATNGKTLDVNQSLLIANARLAARIALKLCIVN